MRLVRIDAVDRLDPNLGWVRRCATCKDTKVHVAFHRNHRDHKGIQRCCKGCAAKRVRKKRPPNTPAQYKARYVKEKEEIIAYSRAYYRSLRGRFLTLISAARVRAKKKGWSHDLDIAWALSLWEQQDGRCHITDIPLEINTPLRTKERYQNPFAPSLDRIDSTKGYTKDNTRLVCVSVNLALNRFGVEVFSRMLEGYARKRGPF